MLHSWLDLLGLLGFGLSIWALNVQRQHSQVARNELVISVARDVHERYSRLYPGLSSLREKRFEELAPDDIQTISLYVNLCAEEYLWKQKGIVEKEVWEVWECAIADRFRNTVVGQVWKRHYSRDKYYKGFAEFIEGILSN